MRLSQLRTAGRQPTLPLSISLADAAGPAELQLLNLLRVLPGQRYVGAGIWRDHRYAGADSASGRHASADYGGIQPAR